MKETLSQLQKKIIACRKCPRLVKYIANIRKTYPSYWCRPVPSFGDEKAQILLLGLAPGRFGSNRTGRMFTGDASGKFLFKALYDLGFANRPYASHLTDGLKLKDVYITAVARCAPPQNKPSTEEIQRCVEYVRKELTLMPRLRVIVALGKIAHDGYLRLKGKKLSQFPFRHGSVYRWDDEYALVDVYHPSRQNTQTGKLTMKMFMDVLNKAKEIALLT